MFLFIQSVGTAIHKALRFKYILCSYLSLFILKIRGCFYYLNTSYVLIYLHMFSINNHLHLKFKYISCSYLSKFLLRIENNISGFKYISCSYLSVNPTTEQQQKIKFKYISCSYLSNVFTHFLFSIISYIALFFNISQLFYQPPPHFSFSSSLVSFPLIL